MLEKIIQNLKNPRVRTVGAMALAQEAARKITTDKLLFYPSAGFDTDDFHLADGESIPELNGYTPDVFIHCDFMCNRDYNGPYELILEASGRFVVEGFFKMFIEHDNGGDYQDALIASEASVEIYRLGDQKTGRSVLLIFYRGFLNKVILRDFLENGIKIPLVYAVCDGMTHGMGLGRQDVIPTIYYPLLAEPLGIRYMVTEQKASWVPERLRNAQGSRGVLQTVSDICLGCDFSSLLALSDENLMKHLVTVLAHNIPEYTVNFEEWPNGVNMLGRDLVVKIIN